MAHFAELDENNIVKRIIVISNEDTIDNNGVEQEEIGIAFCKSLFGEDTKWIQTSYNANFRGIYAMEGDLYDTEKDEFVCIPKGPQFTADPNIIDAEEVPLAIE
jgi:selenocysteine-specific translation elongation factor